MKIKQSFGYVADETDVELDSCDQEQQEYKSRSRKKRESTAMQNRGEELLSLSRAVLQKLPISPELFTAVCDWSTINSHEARRRHKQYIGRLMRELDDPEALVTALAEFNPKSKSNAKNKS